MPRTKDGAFQGNFGLYPGGADYEYPSDEECVSVACDIMFSMCGNAGQETMIGDQLSNFDFWANDALEAEGSAMEFEEFQEMVTEEWYDGRQDKWNGTQYIWQAGFGHVARQSGYHDAADEVGEGKGEEFG